MLFSLRHVGKQGWTHSNHTTEVGHQIVPVVAVVNSHNLVLPVFVNPELLQARAFAHLHTEELLHPHENRDRSVLDHRDGIGGRVRDEGRDCLISRCPLDPLIRSAR